MPEEKKPTIALRRSPRFLQQCQPLVENAETSRTAPRNTRSSRSSPISINISPCKTKRKSNVGLHSGDRKTPEYESLEKCIRWPRISNRSQSGVTHVSGKEEALVSDYVIEKRVTRSSVRGKNCAGSEVNECGFYEGSVKRVNVLSKERNGEGRRNLCEQRVGNIEKMVTRSENRAVALCKASDVASGSFCKVVMSDKRKPKGGLICPHDRDLGMKGAAKLEKRVTRRSSLAVFNNKGSDMVGRRLSNVVCPHDQDLGMEGAVKLEKRVTRRSSLVVFNKGSDMVGQRLSSVVCPHDQDLGMKRAAKLEKRVTRRSSVVEFNTKGSNMVGQTLPNKETGKIEKRVARRSSRGEFNTKGSNMVGQRLPNVVVSDEKKPNPDAIRDNMGFEKRVTRSSSKKSETNEPDLSVEKVDKVEKRITRCSSRKDVVKKASSLLIETSCEVSMSKERKSEDVSRRDAQDFGSKRIHEEIDCVERTKRGEKRKKHQVEEENEIGHGWTVEQELALRKAYFTAKPTPQFWKKVARMVPGKSAEECFDKIQSDHQTPPQPRTRSKAKNKKLSPIPCSASKLLTPVDTKSKKLKPRKMNVLLAQKTVRQLLQKQQNEDKDRGLDLFALFEPTMNDDLSSLNLQECAKFDSPSPPKREEPGVLTKCRGTSSSSASKKQMSRLSSVSFLSPPVLKQIKNKALHEKYIDQLHRRDAKRKAESRRNASGRLGQNDETLNHSKENAVKVAKDALVFDALDAVNRLRSLRSDATDSLDYDDDTPDHSDEDEDEEQE